MPQLSNITVEPTELILLCESSDNIADQVGRIGLVEDVLKVTILLGCGEESVAGSGGSGRKSLRMNTYLKYENFARTEANKLVYRWLRYF